MKKNILYLLLLVMAFTWLRCKSSSDYFVGTWIGCNHADYTCTITKKGDLYVLLKTAAMKNDLILEKKADEVLSIANTPGNGGRKGTLRYDPSTKHLFITEINDHQEMTEEFCKSSTSSPGNSSSVKQVRVIPGSWKYQIKDENDFKELFPYYNKLHTSENGGTLEDFYGQEKIKGNVIHKIVIKESGGAHKNFEWAEYVNDFRCAGYSLKIVGDKVLVYHAGGGDVEVLFKSDDELVFLGREYRKGVE